jgi:hypothetical protein
MNLIISPKDNSNKLLLKDVETFMPEGPTLGVVFKDGSRRNYPLEHIWWYGPDTVNQNRTQPVSEKRIGIKLGAGF